MLGPVHGPIEPELIFELAIDGDDVFAVYDTEGAGELFVDDRKVCSHGDECARSLAARFNFKHPGMRFAVPRQPSGFFFRGHRPESIDTDEESRATIEMRGLA